jgi:hypothetical protein
MLSSVISTLSGHVTSRFDRDLRSGAFNVEVTHYETL